jgi:hypothetical protein
MKKQLAKLLFFLTISALHAQSNVTITYNNDSLTTSSSPPFQPGSILKFQAAQGQCSTFVVEELQPDLRSGKGTWLTAPNNQITTGAASAWVNVKCDGIAILYQVQITPTSPAANPANPANPPNSSNKTLEPIQAAILFDKLMRQGNKPMAWCLMQTFGFNKTDFQTNGISYLQDTAYQILPSLPLNCNQSIASTQATGGVNNIASLPVFNPTMAIDALAKLTAKRFRDELTIAYLDDFRKQIAASNEIKLLLPGTYQALRDGDYFNYSVFLPSLRENAFRDMQEFPRNGQAYLRTRRGDIERINPEAYPVLMSGFDIAQAIKATQTASATIEKITLQDYIQTSSTDYAKMIRGLGAISRCLHTSTGESTTTGWVDEEDLAYVLAHKHAFNFWMATLLKLEHEELKAIRFSNHTQNLYQLLNTAGGNTIIDIQATLFEFNRVAAAGRQLKAASVQSPNRDSLLQLAYAEMAVAVTDLAVVGLERFVNNPDNVKLIKILRTAGRLEQAIRTKQFGAALSQIIEAVELTVVPANGTRPPWLTTFNRYGQFLVNVINANDSDQLLAALEAAAQPVQSYRLKRQPGAFNLSLNIYAGAAIGSEFGIEDNSSERQSGFLLAPTAPLGIALNFGLNNKRSLSAFVPLIDIGAVAAFRLFDNASPLPEQSWDNVLAPGFYLIWGLKNSPISIGLGGQAGPALRKVTVNEVTSRNARIAATFTVDIPVFSWHW